MTAVGMAVGRRMGQNKMSATKQKQNKHTRVTVLLLPPPSCPPVARRPPAPLPSALQHVRLN